MLEGLLQHGLCYFWVLVFFLRLRIHMATAAIAMMMTIGTATTVASVDADDTEIGVVVCAHTVWPAGGVQRIRPFNQLVLLDTMVWYSAMFRVMVPFCMPCTMPVVGTMPVKLARYHTVPNAGGAGAETW